MNNNSNGLQYCLIKSKYLYVFYIGLFISVVILFFGVMAWIEDKEIPEDICIEVGNFLIFATYLLYANFSRFKRKILCHYGVRYEAQIIKAKYANGTGRFAGLSKYYLEIEFINSKGKKKTFYTPAYDGNPNYYLKDTACSVYEWKGFYVESDFQMRDEIDYFGYAGIPTEKKHFIWR